MAQWHIGQSEPDCCTKLALVLSSAVQSMNKQKGYLELEPNYCMYLIMSSRSIGVFIMQARCMARHLYFLANNNAVTLNGFCRYYA